MYQDLVLPSKPRVVSEEGNKGIYEIDSLYPGYGHTFGNSLRRILMSSLPGAAITKVKIEGVDHEFSVIEGVKEDVMAILLNLKLVRFKIFSDEPLTLKLKAKGEKVVKAKDFDVPSQIEVVTPDLPIATLTSKKSALNIEVTVERGIGYVSAEDIQKEKLDVGTMTLDAVFTPIRRVNYEVENMRVGDRTDYNRLRITVQTDGSIAPREALEQAITIMIKQLKEVVGFQEEKEEEPVEVEIEEKKEKKKVKKEKEEKKDEEASKVRIEELDFSTRTLKALSNAGIRTIGGLEKKSAEDLLALEGFGEKSLQEVKKAIGKLGLTLKD